MITDRKPASPIQYRSRTNPGMATDTDLSHNEGTVITGCTLTKSIFTRIFPTISYQIAEGHAPLELRELLELQRFLKCSQCFNHE
ncbi:hypothetical protein AS026_24225 [Rhizobium altiplani]|uniref:Uncharacterized protein n=1 Tax=Rhizobium altiplani TaxID=1864509 RepID=A0A109J2P1_9HYPH|nr:hypothetical protein AS026_24225 [Rhizobium altiplani]